VLALQLLPVLLLRDPVHPYRRILAHAVIGTLQSRYIHQMRQRVEPSFGLLFRSFRYLQQSW